MSSAMEQQVAVAYKRHRRYMTAKKKRELERLREEYNKIKEFNDRSIEMQMRRVRLNHLFREIEVIKEQTAAKVRHQQMHPTIRPKTPEELRKETIKRSKELGIEFSKVNALLYNSFGHGYLTASSPKKTQKKEMSSYEKRKRYGMAISRNYYVQRAQMQMMQMDRKNKKTYGSSSQQALKGSELSKTEVEKIKQLRSRLAYGNQQSYINMLKILHQQKRTIHKSKSMPAYPTTNLDSTDLHASTDNESKLESAIPDTDADTDVEIVRGTVHYTTDEDTKTDTEEANANAQKFVQERFRKLAQFALDLKAKMNRIPELRSPTNSLHQIPSEVNVSAYQMDKMPKRSESLDKFLDAVDSDEQLIKHSKYEQEQQSPREKDVKDEQKVEVSLSPKQNFGKETIIKDLFATPPPLPLPPQRIDLTPASQPQLGIKPQPLLYARTAPPPPPPPRERMPTKQLASTPSFAFHNIFKSSDKPVPANAEKMPPVESPNNTMVTPDPMKIAKMCEEQISETVKHTIMSCKELRQIFEH